MSNLIDIRKYKKPEEILEEYEENIMEFEDIMQRNRDKDKKQREERAKHNRRTLMQYRLKK